MACARFLSTENERKYSWSDKDLSSYAQCMIDELKFLYK